MCERPFSVAVVKQLVARVGLQRLRLITIELPTADHELNTVGKQTHTNVARKQFQ